MTALADRQVAIIGSSVFHSDFLVGGSRFGNRMLSPEDPADQRLFAWRKAFAALCYGHGIAPAHACIQFALSVPGVIAVALDTSYPDRIAENAASAVTPVPDAFFESMKEEGLLSGDV